MGIENEESEKKNVQERLSKAENDDLHTVSLETSRGKVCPHVSSMSREASMPRAVLVSSAPCSVGFRFRLAGISTTSLLDRFSGWGTAVFQFGLYCGVGRSVLGTSSPSTRGHAWF